MATSRLLEVVAENNRRANILQPTYCPTDVYPNGISQSVSAFLWAPVSRLFAQPKYTTRIYVRNVDTLTAANDLKAKYKSTPEGIFVLNFANSRDRGGGYLRGAKAQEEDICRRSNLFKRLQAVEYPWPSEDTVVYSKNVEIFRDEKLDYKDVEFVDVISAAAPYRPKSLIHPNGEVVFARADDRKHMAEKMRSVLRAALQRGIRSGVLGAWGCGAFDGPAYDNARLWTEVLAEPEFAGEFKTLVFAVLGGRNFQTFQKYVSPQTGTWNK